MDDSLILNVRQIAQYPPATAADGNTILLFQENGPGGPYGSITAPDLVSTALLDGTPLKLAAGSSIAFDGSTLSFITGQGFAFSTQVNAPTINAHNVLINGDPAATVPQVNEQFANLRIVNSFNGRMGDVGLTETDILQAGAAPVVNPHFSGVCTAPTIWNPEANDDLIATTAWVQMAICHWYNQAKALGTIVTTFDGRGGDVTLNPDDITLALTSTPGVYAMANTPPLGDASNRIATTLFVDNTAADLMHWALGEFTTNNQIIALNYAPLNSPQFTGIPTAPTAAQTVNSGQLATTAFVHAAVTASTTGVSSWNTRTGAVTLTSADVTAVGGAMLASPTFTGIPTAPTGAPGLNTTQLATCAFVNAAIAGINVGVTTFNTRTGAVVLTTADVTAVGGALLASPAFTGAPTAPTAVATTNNTQLATTAFVVNAIAALPAAVTSFNGRTGAVSFQGSDISAAGGALTASPAFTGAPTAPTQTTGTSNTTLATTAFVAAAVAASTAGVSTFNGRAGVVTLTASDITGAGGALLAGPVFTGVPAAPTATAGTNSTQLATCAFVQAALAAAPGGVSSFNGRTGAITLLGTDVSAVGGALLTSPAFVGAPTAPTPSPGDNSTNIATTAFIHTAIAAAGGVTSFNGRAGVVTLTTADIVAAGAATVAINDVAPASPAVGQLWWDSTAALMYMYYQDPTSSQWVNINNTSGVTEAPTDGRIYARQGSTTSWQAAAPLGSVGSGSIVAINVYSASGTITVPTGVTKCLVQMWGATGGSGGVSNNSSQGTGAGGYLEKYLTGLTAGNTLIYTQGAAGTAGASNGNGGNGGTTMLASGTQTIGTLTCNGSTGSTNTYSGTLSVGGTASGGDVNVTGPGGAFCPNNSAPGRAGINFFSRGADGLTYGAGAGVGNPGNPGGLKITWMA